MIFTRITTGHGGGERRTLPCDGRNAEQEGAHMRQQAKTTIYRLAPVVMLAITVAAPSKWSVQ
jgi:hypothetical protein